METDFSFLMLMAAFAFGPAVLVIIVTQWCKMEKGEKKKRKYQTCLSVPPRPDTRIECPACGLKENRRVIRTYKQPGVAVHRYYKCSCGQPIRQSDKFSDRI